MTDTTVRRLSPPDRRTPIDVAPGRCPAAGACFCCPRKHRRDVSCAYPHPPVARKCRPPYPANVGGCPERDRLPQDAPPAPAGFLQPPVACCVECGRITARRWTDPDGAPLPWCSGLMPDPLEDPR